MTFTLNVHDIQMAECDPLRVGAASIDAVTVTTEDGSTLTMFFGSGLGHQVAAAINAAASGKAEFLPVTTHDWPARPDMAHIEGAEGGQ